MAAFLWQHTDIGVGVYHNGFMQISKLYMYVCVLVKFGEMVCVVRPLSFKAIADVC